MALFRTILVLDVLIGTVEDRLLSSFDLADTSTREQAAVEPDLMHAFVEEWIEWTKCPESSVSLGQSGDQSCPSVTESSGTNSLVLVDLACQRIREIYQKRYKDAIEHQRLLDRIVLVVSGFQRRARNFTEQILASGTATALKTDLNLHGHCSSPIRVTESEDAPPIEEFVSGLVTNAGQFVTMSETLLQRNYRGLDELKACFDHSNLFAKNVRWNAVKLQTLTYRGSPLVDSKKAEPTQKLASIRLTATTLLNLDETWLHRSGKLLSLIERWNDLSLQVNDLNDRTAKLCARLPGYPVSLVPQIHCDSQEWLTVIAHKPTQTDDALPPCESAVSTVRSLLSSADSLHSITSEGDWIRGVNSELRCCRGYARIVLNSWIDMIRAANELLTPGSVTDPVAHELYQSRLSLHDQMRVQFEADWDRLISWTEMVLRRLSRALRSSSQIELRLKSSHERFEREVEQFRQCCKPEPINTSIPDNRLTRLDALDRLHFTMVTEHSVNLEQIHGEIPQLTNEGIVYQNGLILDRIVSEEHLVWSEYQRYLQDLTKYLLHERRLCTTRIQQFESPDPFKRMLHAFNAWFLHHQDDVHERLVNTDVSSISQLEDFIRLCQAWSNSVSIRFPLIVHMQSRLSTLAHSNTVMDSDVERLKTELSESISRWQLWMHGLVELRSSASSVLHCWHQINDLLNRVEQCSEELHGHCTHSSMIEAEADGLGSLTPVWIEAQLEINASIERQRLELIEQLNLVEDELRTCEFEARTVRVCSSQAADSTLDDSHGIRTLHVPAYQPRQMFDRLHTIRASLERVNTTTTLLEFSRGVYPKWHQFRTNLTKLNAVRGELDYLIKSAMAFHAIPLSRVDSVHCLASHAAHLTGQIQQHLAQWSLTDPRQSLYGQLLHSADDLLQQLNDPPVELRSTAIVDKQKLIVQHQLDRFAQLQQELSQCGTKALHNLSETVSKSLQYAKCYARAQHDFSYSVTICRELLETLSKRLTSTDGNTSVSDHPGQSMTAYLTRLATHQHVWLHAFRQPNGPLGQLQHVMTEIQQDWPVARCTDLFWSHAQPIFQQVSQLADSLDCIVNIWAAYGRTETGWDRRTAHEPESNADPERGSTTHGEDRLIRDCSISRSDSPSHHENSTACGRQSVKDAIASVQDFIQQVSARLMAELDQRPSTEKPSSSESSMTQLYAVMRHPGSSIADEGGIFGAVRYLLAFEGTPDESTVSLTCDPNSQTTERACAILRFANAWSLVEHLWIRTAGTLEAIQHHRSLLARTRCAFEQALCCGTHRLLVGVDNTRTTTCSDLSEQILPDESAESIFGMDQFAQLVYLQATMRELSGLEEDSYDRVCFDNSYLRTVCQLLWPMKFKASPDALPRESASIKLDCWTRRSIALSGWVTSALDVLFGCAGPIDDRTVELIQLIKSQLCCVSGCLSQLVDNIGNIRENDVRRFGSISDPPVQLICDTSAALISQTVDLLRDRMNHVISSQDWLARREAHLSVINSRIAKRLDDWLACLFKTPMHSESRGSQSVTDDQNHNVADELSPSLLSPWLSQLRSNLAAIAEGMRWSLDHISRQFEMIASMVEPEDRMSVNPRHIRPLLSGLEVLNVCDEYNQHSVAFVQTCLETIDRDALSIPACVRLLCELPLVSECSSSLDASKLLNELLVSGLRLYTSCIVIAEHQRLVQVDECVRRSILRLANELKTGLRFLIYMNDGQAESLKIEKEKSNDAVCAEAPVEKATHDWITTAIGLLANPVPTEADPVIVFRQRIQQLKDIQSACLASMADKDRMRQPNPVPAFLNQLNGRNDTASRQPVDDWRRCAPVSNQLSSSSNVVAVITDRPPIYPFQLELEPIAARIDSVLQQETTLLRSLEQNQYWLDRVRTVLSAAEARKPSEEDDDGSLAITASSMVQTSHNKVRSLLNQFEQVQRQWIQEVLRIDEPKYEVPDLRRQLHRIKDCVVALVDDLDNLDPIGPLANEADADTLALQPSLVTILPDQSSDAIRWQTDRTAESANTSPGAVSLRESSEEDKTGDDAAKHANGVLLVDQTSLREEETDCIELDQQPSVPRKFGTTGMTTENGDCDYVNETNDSTKASFWATIPTNNGTGDASDYCRDKRNPCRALEPRDRTDAHTNGVGGPIGLDLIEQLRGARNLVQRKLDELSPQVPDEPELMAASCDQLRTFLGQLEAYNFRVAAARTRNAPGPRQMGDTGLGPDELESLWDCVVRLTEAWITALQQAFIQSKGLKQVLTEFRRDLTFVEARLQPFFLSSVRKRLSARRTDSCWRDVTDEIGFTEEDDEDDEELGQLVRTRSYGSGDQTTAEVSHVPTALRLLRVIRFRLSSWFSHVNLLLLTTESTRVLSSITRIQAGRPVQSRFVVDEPTRHELKRLRTSVGRLVDEAERLLTAWSTRSSPGHAGRLTSSRAFSISGSNGAASLGSGTFLSAGTNMNSPGSGYLDSGHRMRFKDQDSFFSSDTDDNVEELVSVTSQSSTSLVSDGSDELVNCEQGVDTSWASEVTAHSLAPSDTTSCGLTATLSTRSSRSTRALAQQQQQLQLQQQRQVEQPPELSTELHQIDAQAPRHSSLGPVDPNHDGPRTSANTPCDTEPTSSTLTFNGHCVDPESPSISHNLPSVQLSASSSSPPPPIMAIDMPHSSKPDRPDWSWLSRRFQLPVFWNRLEQWSRLVQATFTQNEANIQPSSIGPSFQAAQDNHLSSQPLHEPTIPNPVPQSPLSDTKLWPNLTHPSDPTSRTIHSYWASHRRRFWPPWSRRPRFCDFLIGVLFALVLLISFPYLFHIVFSLPYFHATVDVDRQSSCVYHWFQLPWSQDTQEAGPGHTLAKTWPHNAPPF